jgi:hypothetical protein
MRKLSEGSKISMNLDGMSRISSVGVGGKVEFACELRQGGNMDMRRAESTEAN